MTDNGKCSDGGGAMVVVVVYTITVPRTAAIQRSSSASKTSSLLSTLIFIGSIHSHSSRIVLMARNAYVSTVSECINMVSF